MAPERGHQPIMLMGAAGLLAVALVACSGLAKTPGAKGSAGSAGSSGMQPPAVAPPAPQPVADGPCRYLPATSVESANGERVTRVRISATGPGQPYPACFFLTYHDAVQLRTWIVVSTPRAAGATVDAAAPVATSDLVELPGGWSGGSQPTAEGAVFAVAKQGTAVVITTNQRQTIGARRIAEQVIATLGL